MFFSQWIRIQVSRSYDEKSHKTGTRHFTASGEFLGERMVKRAAGSEPRAVVEKPAQADGKDEIAEDGVVQTGQEQRTGVLVGKRKQETPDNAEDYGQPIAENDVQEPESKGAGQNHSHAAAKKRLVTMEEEGAVDEFLRINGNQGVEEHDQGPETGSTFYKGEQELGRKNADRKSQEKDKNSITQEQRQKLRAHVVPRCEMGRIKAGVAAENQESGQRSKQEIGDGDVGQHTVVDQQRDAGKERRELQREQYKTEHRTEPTAYRRLQAFCRAVRGDGG